MTFRLKETDSRLFMTLADCGVLTTTQITALHFGCKKVARRRLSQLAEAGLIAEQRRGLGRAQGQPEKMWSLSEAGFRWLQDQGKLSSGVSAEQVMGRSLHCLDHRILLNWFAIHLRQIQKILPGLSTDFHASESPFAPRSESGASYLQICVSPAGQEEKPIFLIPDAIFRIKDSEQGKSVLFFLEVDMGTETLASPKRGAKDVRQKVLNYQAIFRSGKYRILDGLWRCSFQGFRLLFLANSPERMAFLCRLVQEMPPSDFIWVTDQERMFAHGLADAIWARGGNTSKPTESILGKTLARPSQLPTLAP